MLNFKNKILFISNVEFYESMLETSVVEVLTFELFNKVRFYFSAAVIFLVESRGVL